MRIASLAAMTFCACLTAQVSVDAARFPRVAAAFERESGQKRFGCNFRRLSPALTFAFHFQAGWRLETPFRNVRADAHNMTVIARITPETGARGSVYLYQQANVPKRPPDAKATLQLNGAFLLGPGRYNVEVVALDDSNASCGDSWRIEANPKGGAAPAALDEGEVRAFEPGIWTRFAEAGFERPRSGALTVLLNVAPFHRRSFTTRIGGAEYGMILSSVAALLRFTDYNEIRLFAYNLDQQKIVFQDEHFKPSSLRGLARSMRELNLATVPVDVLRQPRGRSALVSELLERERRRTDPSETVLFFGPTVAYDGKWPAASFPDTRLRYFDFRPYWGLPARIPRPCRAHHEGQRWPGVADPFAAGVRKGVARACGGQREIRGGRVAVSATHGDVPTRLRCAKPRLFIDLEPARGVLRPTVVILE